MTLRLGGFEAGSASQSDLDEYYQLVLDTGRVDRPDEQPPTYETVVSRLVVPVTDRGPSRFWAAHQDDHLVGLADLGLPGGDNRHIAITDIRVHPRWRRRGIGTALLAAAIPTLRREARSIVAGWGVTAGGAGAAWADARGFRVVHHDVLQMLALGEVDPRIWNLPVPPGYRTVRWIGTAPGDLVASYALSRTALQGAPTEESTFRAPTWTKYSVRAAERGLRERGIEERVVVAVHRATGSVAGHTAVEIRPHRGDLAYQADTAVLPDHRGRGLGRVVKAEMIRWLRVEHPQITRIGTSTAAGNTHMIKVNHDVGYRTVRDMVDVEADLDPLSRMLDLSVGNLSS